MQRLYEGVFDLAKLGIRNTPRAILWLLAVTAFVSLRPLLLDLIGGWLHAAATLALSTLLWLITPYLLLGRRVSWQRLLPGALLTAIGMAGVGRLGGDLDAAHARDLRAAVRRSSGSASRC